MCICNAPSSACYIVVVMTTLSARDGAICVRTTSEAVGLQTQVLVQLCTIRTSSLYVATISPCHEKLAHVT